MERRQAAPYKSAEAPGIKGRAPQRVCRAAGPTGRADGGSLRCQKLDSESHPELKRHAVGQARPVGH